MRRRRFFVQGNGYGEGIWQETIVLPYFNYEIPVVYLADGTAYLPVRALCRMLGLRADAYIPRWQKLVIWCNARKLPLHTTRGKRIVWCIHRGALPLWCSCFDWSLVEPVQYEQLCQATNAWLADVAQAQRLLLDRYRSLRSYLFAFLEAYSDAETWLNRWALHFSSLDVAFSLQRDLLLSQGKTLIGQATAQARKMVQEQAMAPIVDMITLDENGAGVETGTLPLFPVVAREDREQFFAYMSQLIQWRQEMAAFVGTIKLSQNSDQSEGA
jgi:hypothetical protein